MVVKVTVEQNNIAVVEAGKASLDEIDANFKHPDFSNCWVYGRFRKENIVMRHMMIRSEGVNMGLLPIGLLPELERFLKSKNATFKVFDKRAKKNFSFADDQIRDCLGYLTLRPFQVEAVQKCLAVPNGIVKAPTAAGKTELAIALCKLTGLKTLILFKRIDLAHQTLARMRQAGVDAGIVQGENVDENHQVVMMTVQSAHKLRQQYEMVLVDEVHNASGEQYQAILRSPCFLYRYGFSATPLVKGNHLKNALVKGFIGDIIYEVGAKTLIEEERIAKPTIRFLPITMPKDIEPDGKWAKAERLGIVENDYRNKLIAKLCARLKGSTLVLVVKIDQGERLNELIPGSCLLFGKTKVKQRREVVRRFESGEDFTLIASTIFDEGIDIKSVNNVVVCGGGASFIKTLQRLGRGLRVTATKKSVDIYDFFDHTHPILSRHSKKRIETYKNEGFGEVRVLENRELLKLLRAA